MRVLQLHEIGLDLTFSMLQMLERDIVKAFLDTRDQMLKFARHKAKVCFMLLTSIIN